MDILSKNILIIESDETTRNIIHSNLKAVGFKKIVSANSGYDAINSIDERQLDIIIIAMNLSDVDGFSMIQRVKKYPQHSMTKYLLITNDISPEEIDIAINLGIDDFIIKPFTHTDLTRTVQSVLSGTHPPLESKVSANNNDSENIEPSIVTDKAQKQTILVVDDLSSNIDVISSFLKNKYIIRVAKNGKKALSITRSDKQPDLILLDIMMPEMSGFDVCLQLKQDPATADIPVIFLTGNNNEQDIAKGLKIGAVDFIHKPVSPAVLLARIDIHLKLQQTIDNVKSEIDISLENKSLQKEILRLKKSNDKLKAIISSNNLKIK
ncbi:MAG: response regulator [gamma proteobacterium symbiont of Taylorina sp.]|nr:response regulator [gamma proteobacterium symbiont of Taylorina sp.]